ncbi:NAD(P)-dependent oxidoreductase [Paenibacillus zeisoli]|uniref:NAD(P)-dependent oxidoreductase n=1 Tax=Paenibacillus zeisoli TaxID=2496267 RepID=A0A433XC71_9BACL|nr:NAD(P)-dependent oxidoreductase [Paenibacillus zeisoli]RUT31634.1 NAD(P)-dependent oxidoreductase [Paenibacillus zeisoli]
MKILVAGAAGVVGRYLVPQLVHEGHQVTGITHKEENTEVIRSLGARPIVADVYNREHIFSILEELRPDVLIHQLTSLSSRNFSDNNRIRTEGTRNLVDAAKAAGVNRLIAQSIAWAYEPGSTPAEEEVPLDIKAPLPRQITIEGVAALEQAAAEIPEHVILRYGTFYGPGTWYDNPGWIAEQVLQGQIQAGDGLTSFIHVKDAALAAVQALNWPSGAVNIVDNEPAAGRDWLPVYAEALGAPKPVYEPGLLNRGERGASNSKARLEYGWEPLYPTWRTGFAQSLHTH